MRVAIVTGASSGIGRALAMQLDAEESVDELWLVARREERLVALAASLAKPSRLFVTDVTERDAETAITAALAESRATVSYAVLAAGAGVIGGFAALPSEEEAAIIDLNCRSQVTLLHALLPYLSDGSRVIGIASAAAFCPQPGFAVYAATKAFFLSFLRGIRTELRPRGIAVTAVCPGPVRTEFFNIAERHAKMSAFKKTFFTTPEKVAKAALRASKRNRAVTTPSVVMKLFRVLAKILPHSLLCAMMGDKANE